MVTNIKKILNIWIKKKKSNEENFEKENLDNLMKWSIKFV